VRWPLLLLTLLLALGVALGIDPYDRADWALENALAVVAVVLLVLTARRFPLSKLSYTLIWTFLVLHEIGAHWTYALVPYDDAWRKLFGCSFNELVGWQRNNYDRVVHFAFGFLLAYPMRELFVRVGGARGFWGYFLPLEMTLSFSCVYEIVEWGAAVFFGGDLGVAYLGTQGDVWDAQKDMACAGSGALIAIVIVALVHRTLDRDFQREWAESLRVKREPLGEAAIERLRGGTRL